MMAAGRKSKTSHSVAWSLAGIDLFGAEALEHERHRMRGADRVGNLELSLVGETRRHHRLGDVTRHVRRGPIHLGGVLAAERPPAVRREPSVGVDDDLATRQPGIGLGSTDLEAPGGVDQHSHRRRVEVAELAQHGVDHLGLDVGLEECLDVDLFAMLRADEHRVDRHRLPVDVPDGHLGLAVGAQIRNDARFADVGEAFGQPVGHGDRHRHELVGVSAREAEHHALVARAEGIERIAGVSLPMLEGVVDALRDIRRLLLDRGHDPAGVPVQPELGIRIAHLNDGSTNDLRHVDPRLGRDLAGDECEPSGDEGLARHA